MTQHKILWSMTNQRFVNSRQPAGLANQDYHLKNAGSLEDAHVMPWLAFERICGCLDLSCRHILTHKNQLLDSNWAGLSDGRPGDYYYGHAESGFGAKSSGRLWCVGLLLQTD